MFTPAFYWMVRRFPIRGERSWTRLPIHTGASFIFVLLKVSLYTPLYDLLNPEGHRTYSMVLFGGFYGDMLAYWASIGVIHAIEYYRESRARELEATRLALENLRAQLQPHFLFNTLQSISTLIHRDQDGPGLAAPPGDGNGIGLANTRERVARLYGAAGTVELLAAGGLTVRIAIPFRT